MAILKLVSFRPWQCSFMPIVMITTAILATDIASTGFGYGATTDPQSLEDSDRT